MRDSPARLSQGYRDGYHWVGNTVALPKTAPCRAEGSGQVCHSHTDCIGPM